MRQAGTAGVLVSTGMIIMSTIAADSPIHVTPRDTDVIVCVGDSITDGYTYAQLILQALKEARKPVPTMVCGGVVCDTAPLMAARLDKTVLIHKPAIVTLSAGTNDSLHQETPEEYEKAVREIARKVKAMGGTMILLTPCVVNPGTMGDENARKASRENAEAAEKLVSQYADIIRNVAAEEGFAVAENNVLMRRARDEGKEVMSPDGIHPNYLGQSLMARSILDAMGYADVPLPAEFKPQLFPGVVREWKMRLAPAAEGRKQQILTAETIKALRPDDTWKTYKVPDPVPTNAPSAEDWWEQERRNGFACQVEKEVGKGLVQAVAIIDSPEARKAYVNTASGVASVWLNGKKVCEDTGNRIIGFHAGRERFEVELDKGPNTLIAEINSGAFFLSVTDKLTWESDLR